MTQISGSAFSTAWPLTFARGRNGDLYGVNGEQRGFRWDGVTASVEQLGISKPASKPSITASASSPKYDLLRVDLVDPGSGYASEPTITVTGTSTAAAKTRPVLIRGSINSVRTLRYGAGYTTTPTVTCSEPDLLDGSGAVLTPITDTVTIGDDTAVVVTGITVTNGGSNYRGFPRVVFSGDHFAGDPGTAGVAELTVDGGVIQSASVVFSGTWASAPTLTVFPDKTERRRATAAAVMAPAIRGKFWCALRYIDDTAAGARGPIPSSISDLTAVEVDSPAGSLAWSWSNAGMEERVDKIELWRTTADQALVLYRVATVSRSATAYTDTLSDTQLADPSRTGFAALPITLPNGQVNARRFNPPPQNKRAVAIFQDRAWYGVDVPGKTFSGSVSASHAEPNTLYFSEADEPESVPEVNQIVLQENLRGQDRISALMPFGGGMVVFQNRRCYRLSFVSQPLIDANLTMIAQRGCLNQRCWDIHDGVAYVVDSYGMYMLDGSNAVPLSDPVDPFWSENLIHWASSKWFFVRVDPATRVARFFFAVAQGFPDRALCFHPLTKAWWIEQYAQTIGALESAVSGGRQKLLAGGQGGELVAFESGDTDRTAAGGTQAISCSFRTGNLPLVPDEKDRAIRVLYKPTSATCALSLALHYNNSASPRPAAVATDRGSGFTTNSGQNASLNLSLTRSALGTATGYALCHYSGRVDDRSAGGDRHLSIALSLDRPSGEPAVLYGVAAGGVSQ